MFTVVVTVFEFAIVPCEGPEISVHLNETITPSASFDAEPSTDTELAGSVIVWLAPAFATGGWLGAGFTVTVTFAVAERPPLSVALKLEHIRARNQPAHVCPDGGRACYG